MKCECAPKYVFLDIFLLISALKCITLDDHRWHAEWKTSDTRAGAKLALVSLEQSFVREISDAAIRGVFVSGWAGCAERAGQEKHGCACFSAFLSPGMKPWSRAASPIWRCG